MKPVETGRLYNNIASWWDQDRKDSTYGLPYVQRAIEQVELKVDALDVGCGSGGLILAALLAAGFRVTGIDLSEAMLALAAEKHPPAQFVVADICEWQPPQGYDIIIAWDSIFHVPYDFQAAVVTKLCRSLNQGGVILFTAGGIDGEITGQMKEQTFYYSSLDVVAYLDLLARADCDCLLLERDQYPADHVVIIGKRKQGELTNAQLGKS